jgi:ABC-type uncharacterized transport system ATPase subunit
VLAAVSFAVRQGELFSIIGPNGAGDQRRSFKDLKSVRRRKRWL